MPSCTDNEPSLRHRHKRLYQQQPITSFFGVDASNTTTQPQPRSSPAQKRRDSITAAHTLPPSVQANLLSVGMRVRKSVPEGYKTHKPAHLPIIQTHNTITPPRDPVPPTYQHPRELLPFCGLNKIGGFAEQPVTNVHLYGGGEEVVEKPVALFPLPAEAFNTPFSGPRDPHSTMTSTESIRTPNPNSRNKRSWSEEREEKEESNSTSTFLFAFPVSISSEDEVPVSPLSSTPTHSILNNPVPVPNVALRPFAQPKSRRHVDGGAGGGFRKDGLDIVMDVENVETDDEVGNGFDEAEFLEPRPWGPGEVVEVEMGGV